MPAIAGIGKDQQRLVITRAGEVAQDFLGDPDFEPGKIADVFDLPTMTRPLVITDSIDPQVRRQGRDRSSIELQYYTRGVILDRDGRRFDRGGAVRNQAIMRLTYLHPDQRIWLNNELTALEEALRDTGISHTTESAVDSRQPIIHDLSDLLNVTTDRLTIEPGGAYLRN